MFQKRIRPESFFVLVHNLGIADVCFHSYFLAEVVDYPGAVVFLFLAPDRISGQEVCQEIVLGTDILHLKIVPVGTYNDVGDLVAYLVNWFGVVD